MWRRAALSLVTASMVCALGASPLWGYDRLPFFRHKQTPPPPPNLVDVARIIDKIEEDILDQGAVVIKQPDIWSQARMTKFRKEFEDTMAMELTEFAPYLSARIARSDAAAFASQTALAASLTPLKDDQPVLLATPGEVTSERNTAMGWITSGGSMNTVNFADATKNVATSNFSLLNSLAPTTTKPGEKPPLLDYNFGLEPNVMLDQRADYIGHLHRLRRINLGDDNADSAGYGLYLMRIPVSIQPGNHTVRGHGAIVNVTMQHDFGPGFLPSTYRNLVINDIIDKLSPVVHELIRNGKAFRYRQAVEDYREAKARQDAAQERATAARAYLERLLAAQKEAQENAAAERKRAEAARQMQNQLEKDAREAPKKPLLDDPLRPTAEALAVQAQAYAEQAREAEGQAEKYAEQAREAGEAVAAAQEKGEVEAAVSEAETAQALAEQAAQAQGEIESTIEEASVTLPVSRTGSRINAIAPSDLRRVFGPQNLLNLAFAAQQTLDLGISVPPETHKVRLNDVRNFLRHELESAYDLMAGTNQNAVQMPLLMDIEYIESLTDAVVQREYEVKGAEPDSHEEGLNHYILYESFAHRLPGNLRFRPAGVLSWAIAIEAGLLNRYLRHNMKETKGADGFACPPNIDSLFFYPPTPTPDAVFAFQEYVKARWPMITFALEPVTDQQNIEDAFTRRRDLQLAISFALAAGRLSFRQAMQYQRQLQYEAQTIALNQTVAAFAHGNDTFGWRFTPRYQTPPEESNPEAIANLLLRGGPGPNYQLRNSKLEPGMRELTAVVVMPSFVRGMRLDVSTDWFELHDPDDHKIPTTRTVKLGHQINEARNLLAAAIQCGNFRAEDTERLRVKLHQLEAMLPLQTSFVQVPYENTLGGFALFTQGVTALIPELVGFEGIDYLNLEGYTDILVHGKHFSLYEMSVVAGGVELPREGTVTYLAEKAGEPLQVGRTLSRTVDGKLVVLDADGTPRTIDDRGSYNILSREVLRVRIPPGVTTTRREDGQEIVELYVSTPNGISNRLAIPARRVEFPVATQGPSYVIANPVLTIQLNGTLNGNTVTPVGIRPLAPGTFLEIMPYGIPDPLPTVVNLRIVMPGPANTVLEPIDIVNVPLVQGSYVVDTSQLNKFAAQLYKQISDNRLTYPPVQPFLSRPIVVVTVPGNISATTTTGLEIRFDSDIVLPGPTASSPSTLAPGQAVAAVGEAPQPRAVPDSMPDPMTRRVAHGANGSTTAPVTPAAFQPGGPPVPPEPGVLPPGVLPPVAIEPEVRPPVVAQPPPAEPGSTTVSPPPLPTQTSQTLLVLPQQAPSVNVSVPINNLPPLEGKHHGLFRRRERGPTTPERPTILERLRGLP